MSKLSRYQYEDSTMIISFLAGFAIYGYVTSMFIDCRHTSNKVRVEGLLLGFASILMTILFVLDGVLGYLLITALLSTVDYVIPNMMKSIKPTSVTVEQQEKLKHMDSYSIKIATFRIRATIMLLMILTYPFFSSLS